MKLLQTVAAALALTVCATATAATKPGVYVRGSLGYSHWNVKNDVEDKDYTHFALKPVVGFSNLTAVEGLSFEAFFDMDFGSKTFSDVTLTSKIFTPGFRAVYEKNMAELTGNRALKQLVPYVGAGLCFPIVVWDIDGSWSYWTGSEHISGKISESDRDIYFVLDTLGGWRYDFSKDFAATAELGIRFGTDISWSLTAGALYRFN
ncbi:MAG: outer membrane beta-barrel protein [Treponema sp.]|nr:outer membrane beta-barrel protein [Treponema sp.]